MCLGRQAQKSSYFNAQFYRLTTRRGPKKAVCAVAASLLTTIYHMLKDGTQFQDLGATPLQGKQGQTPCRQARKAWLRR